MARDGLLTEDSKSRLSAKKGIEVGNIFQLGYHYTKLMKGAAFIDEDGKEKPYYMGCYGIGIGRTQAAIVEKYHDGKGIIWPEAVAPYQVHLIDLKGPRAKGQGPRADEIVKQLEDAGIEILWDDRDNVSAGEKFADADLIGIPWRMVVSAKTGDKIELKKRSEPNPRLVSVEEIVELLK